MLGNRQLLSGFFIVVMLFGVFFVMGYIVGRNSAPPADRGDAMRASARQRPNAAVRRLPAPAPAQRKPAPRAAAPPKDDAGDTAAATRAEAEPQAAQPRRRKTEAAAPHAARLPPPRAGARGDLSAGRPRCKRTRPRSWPRL